MSQKQLQRRHVMKRVEVGKITLKEAGEKVCVSYWQAKRIGIAIRDKGMKAFVHGNRGRPSWKKRTVRFLRKSHRRTPDSHC